MIKYFVYMDSKELLKSISSAFFSNENERVIYFSLTGGLLSSLSSIMEKGVLTVDLLGLNAPLAPFLDILKTYKIPEDHLKESVYHLHYNVFNSYLNGKSVEERPEPLLPEEVDYETSRSCEAVCKLFAENFDGKLVILNAHLMSSEALRILEKLEKALVKGKILVCFNSVEVENYTDGVRKYLDRIINSNSYYSFNSNDVNNGNVIPFAENDSEYSVDILIETCRSLRLFLDLSKAYSFMKEIDSCGILEEYEPDELRKLNYEMGLIAFFNRDYDFASFCFNKIIDTDINDELACYTLYMLARVETVKNMNSVAHKHINRGLVLAKSKPKSAIYALLTMMDYIITAHDESEYSTTKYFNAIKLLEDCNLTNNKIHTLLNIPYGVMYDAELRKEMFRQIEISQKEAEAMDNKFELSTVCHWKGILLTHEGKKEEAVTWYQKCFALREEIGDLDSITKILNGLAYGNFLDSKYKAAYEQINDVVEHLGDIKDYPEVVITLNNMARTSFYAKNFDIAGLIYHTVLNLFKIFDVSDLSGNSFIPEYNDIAIYVANIDFYKNEINRAKMNLYNVMNNGKKIGVVERYMIDYLNACLTLEDGNKDKAVKILWDSIHDFLDKKINQFHQLVFYMYEFASMLKKHGYSKESDEFFQEGLKIAKENNLTHYTMGKESIILEEYESQNLELGDLNISLRMLEEKAEKEKLLNRIHRRLRDSQFLNKLVSTNVDILSDLTYANNAVRSIFDYTMADAVYIGERDSEDGQWNCIASLVREGNYKFPADITWWKYSKEKGVLNTYEYDENTLAIFMNLSKFGFVSGIIIFIQKKNQPSIEERNILSVAASNIQAQLIMLKQNEYLSQISVTDQLSALNNRRALEDHLSVESELIRRYEKKKNLHMKEAIAFMDLDNFKYYNDTFGHEAGDFLISSFARLLKRIYRKVDFIARFGGDEFVVMLPNTNCDEAKRAAERLKDGLEEEQNFVPALEKMLGKNLDIPKDKYLNFSMGICSNIDCEDTYNLEKVMIRADQALYYSKEHQKGSVTIWDDVKHLLKDKAK